MPFCCFKHPKVSLKSPYLVSTLGTVERSSEDSHGTFRMRLVATVAMFASLAIPMTHPWDDCIFPYMKTHRNLWVFIFHVGKYTSPITWILWDIDTIFFTSGDIFFKPQDEGAIHMPWGKHTSWVEHLDEKSRSLLVMDKGNSPKPTKNMSFCRILSHFMTCFFGYLVDSFIFVVRKIPFRNSIIDPNSWEFNLVSPQQRNSTCNLFVEKYPPQN